MPLINDGDILGRGVFRSGGLTNNNLVSFADGDTDVLGPVTNNAELRITNNVTTFFDPVTNTADGTIKNTDGVARFLAGLTNDGALISDPADNVFADLVLGESGYLVGGQGDRFFVSGDFLSSSTQSTQWQTEEAELIFYGGTDHEMSITGVDRGPGRPGYVDNYAWGVLTLESGQSLTLSDGNPTPGGALYVGELNLVDGLAQLASIDAGGLNVYYDPALPANSLFDGGSFALGGGGVLLAVPEPSTMALGAIALLGLVAYARRRRLVGPSPRPLQRP